jgi:uncharacterized protein YrrD
VFTDSGIEKAKRKQENTMRKAKSLLGLNIITREGGQRLGTVRDLIFTEGTQKLVALLLTDRELFGMIDATCVPWTQVREIGSHAIMVESDDSAQKVHADPVIAEGYDARFTLDGKQVTTDTGEKLGTISDVYLDDTGHILGYEVSGGMFADAFSGKRYMEAPLRITMGQDVIIVPQDVVIQLERDREAAASGVQTDVAPATTSTSDSPSLADSISGAFASAKEKVTAAYDNMANASVEKQREYVIGKTAAYDVIIPAEQATMATPQAITTHAVESGAVAPTDTETLLELQKPTHAMVTDVSSSGEVVDGEVLVRKGELITAAHADRGIAAGVLGSLVTAATGGALTGANQDTTTVQGVHSQETAGESQSRSDNAAIGKPSAREVVAPDGSILIAPGMPVTREILARAEHYGKKPEVLAAAGMGAVSQNAKAAYGEVKESAQTFWGQLKEKTSELTGMAQTRKAEHDQASEEKKIKSALGRPVTRVILAKDDSIILNTGDIVTNRAVEEARAADVLEILLDSVYDATPEIAPEMLRARESGTAALPSQIHADEVPPTQEEADARAAHSQPQSQPTTVS